MTRRGPASRRWAPQLRRQGRPGGRGLRKAAFTALDEVHDTAQRMLDAFGHAEEIDRAEVVWLDGATERRPPILRVAPLTVAGMLRDKLFGDRTVVLTSATLALGGTFDGLARQWGLGSGPSSRDGDGDGGRDWSGMDVGSPSTTRAAASSTSPSTCPSRAATACPRSTWRRSPS
nr:hypothetical protein GCM10020093_038240 [Planobispora longispora]